MMMFIIVRKVQGKKSNCSKNRFRSWRKCCETLRFK